ncbi:MULTISPECIES: ketopantoate reductase family protein [unclassified Sedimentibacter]|uniref:ketopantoate reductase family protein n=1 Tax=unclassified Sedimentibacter TaxID=2649220 RepID=UPI001BD559C5|nr:2-dehydropantoate 2-reductase [Sedimentibacter sp. MB35-C1]WMJ75966.1 2-dehydropantoate 2-reductase [Sedimentibacter sp. MB35-C1]
MKVAIIGAGAMGSIYGGFLAEAGNEVYFLDVYKEHVDNINRDGLWMEGTSGDRYIKGIKATSDPNEVGVVELAIVFVKSTITDIAIAQNKAVIGEDTIVLTLQNGLGNIEKLETIVKKEQIITGTTSHGANLLGPGRVKHAGHGATVIGELDGKVTEKIKGIAKVLEDAGLKPVKVSTNVMGIIWDKVLVNVGINALTALTGLKNGQLLENPETENILGEAVKEAEMVAKAAGINLATPNPADHCKEVARVTKDNISSMLADVNNKRKTEISNINGAIVREGEKYNIDTPVNKVLTNLVLMKEKMYQIK